MAPPRSVIQVVYEGRLATVTIDNDERLNALSQSQYYELARALREIAAHDEVYITLLTAKGRYFSAGGDLSVADDLKNLTLSLVPSGADVSAARDFGAVSAAGPDPAEDAYRQWLRSFAANNLEVARAFYSHPKVLVVGLNGPVVGLSAALVALADLIYCTPATFLLTPFSSLGLVAEGVASRALVQRLGIARANEALLMSRRIEANELAAAGFVNRIFPVDKSDGGESFRRRVRAEVDDRLGPHLVGDSLIGIKKLIRQADREVFDRANVAEVFAGLDRFMTGVPQEEFRKVATGQKRHKL